MDKKVRITYTVCGMDFTAEVSTVSEAYEYIKAIVVKERINFPDREETLSGYMDVLVKIKNGSRLRHENHIFVLETVQEATKNE